MQQAQKELLLQILNIINYTKDKEKFIKEFEALNYFEALVNMLEKLPEHLRDSLREIVINGNRDEIKKYVTPEAYIGELKKTAEEAVTKFVSTISPVLTLDQKQKIHQLMRQ